MSRGLGNVQRSVIDALLRRANLDRYVVPSDAAIYELIGIEDPPRSVSGRWRWYTVDLLGLTNASNTRAARVSLHRAVRKLGESGHLEVSVMPYDNPWAAYRDYEDRLQGGIDLTELRELDRRWPSRMNQTLWFRLPPPEHGPPPARDQVAILEFIDDYHPEPFADFAATLDREKRWRTPTGEFLAWLFLGSGVP